MLRGDGRLRKGVNGKQRAEKVLRERECSCLNGEKRKGKEVDGEGRVEVLVVEERN